MILTQSIFSWIAEMGPIFTWNFEKAKNIWGNESGF